MCVTEKLRMSLTDVRAPCSGAIGTVLKIYSPMKILEAFTGTAVHHKLQQLCFLIRLFPIMSQEVVPRVMRSSQHLTAASLISEQLVSAHMTSTVYYKSVDDSVPKSTSISHGLILQSTELGLVTGVYTEHFPRILQHIIFTSNCVQWRDFDKI